MLVTSHQNPPHLTLARGPSLAASKIFVGQGLPLALRDQRDSAGNQRTILGTDRDLRMDWTPRWIGDGGETRTRSTINHGGMDIGRTHTLLTHSPACPFSLATFLNPRREPDALQRGPARGSNYSCIIWTPCPSHPPQLRGFPEDNALLLCCSSLTFGL